MASVLAHAMPTPVIESSSRNLLWMMATESRPRPPQIRQRLCVPLRPNRRANAGRRNEKPKHTSEYIPKQTPPHSTPAEYIGELVSGAPNTFRATATGKYSHMQKSPSHVHICTQANCRIVPGMALTEARISSALPSRLRFSDFFLLNSSRLSGGYSPVETMVHRTALINAAAPI